ncbi:MAG: HNH endonuclease signature motif containing protein, partial [Candidatus Microthrix parvicella]
HWSASAYEEMLHAIDDNRPPAFDPDTFMCRTDDGHDLDPTETAVTSLFSQFRRIVIDAKSVVIDLGRARRFTGSARTAATATNTHCIWPGCHAPAGRCDIDHLTQHSHNGPTNPSNSAPLCGKHKRWKQKGFSIRRLPDGTWHTTRPDGSQLE